MSVQSEALEEIIERIKEVNRRGEISDRIRRELLGQPPFPPMPTGYYPTVIFDGYVPAVYDGHTSRTGDPTDRRWYHVSNHDARLSWEELVEKRNGLDFTVVNGTDNREESE